jgi:transcriptional regulator with XRE-family HTH domain
MADEADSTAPDPVAVAIGTRIMLERERAGLTKEELGARSGLSSRYVWRVEVGRLNVQLRNLAKIAAGLDLTVAQLTDGLEALVDKPLDRPKPKRRGPQPKQRNVGGGVER